jgi:hypothetical protein
MRSTATPCEISLRNFVREKITPTIVKAIEEWRGDIGFNPRILAETGNRNLAYHGFDCCLHAAQIAQYLLEEEQTFGHFDLVAPFHNKHHLLRHHSDDRDPLIIDPSIRQHTSHPAMDMIGQLEFEIILQKRRKNLPLSEQEIALAKAISKHIRKAQSYDQQEVEQIHDTMLNVARTTDAVFVGRKSQLEEQIRNTFFEKIEPALKFDRALTRKMIEDSLQCYVGNPSEWQETSPEFIKKAADFFPPSGSPSKPSADPIWKMIHEIRRGI